MAADDRVAADQVDAHVDRAVARTDHRITRRGPAPPVVVAVGAVQGDRRAPHPQRAGGQRSPPRDPYAALVPVLNARIREIATAENVPLVDMFDVFNKDMTLIGLDDVHPTPRGFKVMAETFFAAIQKDAEQPHPAIGSVR